MYADVQEYDRVGVPRALAIMCHGAPGTGKTSLSKALAHHLKRHLVKIDLGLVQTKEELNELFDPYTLRMQCFY